MNNIFRTALGSSSIVLEPLTAHQRQRLAMIAQNEQIWTYNPSKLTSIEETFARWFTNTLKKQSTGEHWPLTIIRKLDNKIIGTSRYYDVNRDSAPGFMD